MRPRDLSEQARLDGILRAHHQTRRTLPGIEPPARRRIFLEQLLESIHRVQYIERGILCKGAAERPLHPDRANPASDLFDPLKAAALHSRAGVHDEACWLVFLFTHFGKNLRTDYRLARDVYGNFGRGPNWTWARTSAAPESFRAWLRANENALKNDGTPRFFGNHRKYQSLDADKPNGTGEAFVTYVRWVLNHRNHQGLFDDAEARAGHDRRRAFDLLYRSMKREVASFARMGAFDYLAMIAKLGLADIEPGSTYMTGATGPLEGARLLYGPAAAAQNPATVNQWLVELEADLGLPMGMQILEDALCNWQKSPDALVRFRG
jgi:Alpha-glutamyl/putrescinyl thymine pyrophosphorylase clade 3